MGSFKFFVENVANYPCIKCSIKYSVNIRCYMALFTIFIIPFGQHAMYLSYVLNGVCVVVEGLAQE